MKNKAVVVAVILLLLVGGWWMSQKKNGGDMQTGNEKTVTKENNSGLSTLKDLLTDGKDQKCTWSFADGEQMMEGTVVVSGQRFRQEVIMNNPENNQKMQIFSISDGEYMYSWNSAAPDQGVKIKITEAETTPKTDTNPSEGKVDWGKEYEYKCEAWTLKEEDLTPPANINFVDLNAQLEQLKGMQEQFKGLIPNEEPEE
jgi:hypothetical protein